MPKIFKGGQDTIKLIAGHAMIMPHLPSKINLTTVSNKLSQNPSQDVASLGLFDSSTPNYTTYYPDVTEEDLNPKESDFIEPVFRLLSNTVVQQYHNPIEFPADVLKASMKKLVGITVNVDHETALGNAIGTVKSVEWQESYKASGMTIPAGINAVLKIDGKSNPRIARGIMMEPPSIHSNSVTVMFTWVPSHPTLGEDEFYNKLGTYDEKGKLVRKVASDIMFYRETSLVGMGADPFAQKVSGSKIVNPTLAKSRKPVDSKALKDEGQEFDAITIDWKNLDAETGTFTLGTFEIDVEEQNNKEMEQILLLLTTIFGLEEGSLTEDNYEETLNGIAQELTSLRESSDGEDEITIEGLTGMEVIANAIKELNTLKAGIPEGRTLSTLVSMSTIGETALSDLRKETKRLYALSLKEGKTEDQNIINLIDTASFETVTSLHKQYNEASDDNLEFTCNKCGSHEVSRQSSKPSGDGDEHVEKTTEELIEDITSKSNRRYIFSPSK